MSGFQRNIMIIAGEVSGDLIGAGLINELRRIDPNLKIFGIGGNRMQEAGMQLNFHIKDMAFLGFTEVLRHLPFIRRVQGELLRLAETYRTNVAVLIDYPGFNLNIARKLKSLGIKVIYYVSPQVWAWGSGRLKKIKKYTDKMLVLFPFEENLYKKNNIDVKFVGHPLIDVIDNYKFLSRNEFYQKFNLDYSKEILLLMPGSRKHEISRLFPEMVKSAQKLCVRFNLQAVVACPSSIEINIFNEIYPGDYKVVHNYTYDLMKYSLAGIIKSGTSTLEAALFELPMVVVYKTSRLTYLIGKKLIKLDNIGLVNIISGEEIVPELLQNNLTAESICKEVISMLSDHQKLVKIKEKLKGVKEKLGEKGASGRAAVEIYNELQKD